MAIITIKDLHKSYAGTEVLKGIELEVDNEFLFLAGKNGSGKTTLIKCALDLLGFDKGSILYDGKCIDDVRNDVGVVFDEARLYFDFSGYKNIEIFDQGFLADEEYVQEVLETLELSGELLRRRVGTYSLGQRHRMAVAVALIRRPRYIFLDEPTIGLDPVSWGLVKECLLKLKKEKGLTAIITGQDYVEMSKICESVAILNNGKIVYGGKMVEFINSFPQRISFDYIEKTDFGKCVKEKFHEANVEEQNGHIVIEVSREDVEAILNLVYESVKPINLKVEDYELKEAFLRVVSNEKKVVD